MIIHELHQDEIKFSSQKKQKLYNLITSEMEENNLINLQKLTNNADIEISSQTINIIAQAYDISDNWKQQHNIITGREEENLYKATKKAILSLKKEIVNVKISELQKKLHVQKLNDNEIQKLSQLTKLKAKFLKC